MSKGKFMAMVFAKLSECGIDVSNMTGEDAYAKYRSLIDEGKIKAPESESPTPSKKRKSQEEFFGEEFSGVKGAEAVEKLLSEKRGHVKGAFSRPELGSVDLVWGDERGGLLHSMQKRDKLLKEGVGTISGEDMARKIPEIMDNGTFDIDDEGRMGVDFDNYHVAIRPTYYEKKVNWIVTAMETFGNKKKTE